MKEEWKLALLIFVVFVASCAVFYSYGYERGACAATGGVYVKDLYKMRCIKEQK